jgi:hypothetical protein
VGFRVFTGVTALPGFFTTVGIGVSECPSPEGVPELFAIIGKRKKPPTRTAMTIMTAMIIRRVFFPGLKPVPRGGDGGTGGSSERVVDSGSRESEITGRELPGS